MSFFHSTEFLVDSEFSYNEQLMLIAKVPSVDSYQHFSALYFENISISSEPDK